jgi:uncharacterized protein (DUF58 family)
MSRPSVELPSPSVRFQPGFLARVGALALALRAARERREGPGRASLFGVGAEFVGYRPYRPGDDLRALDWAALARLSRPYVRLARREASERWCILLDTSASMGVGRPGKLQCASEVAVAVAALARAPGAEGMLHVSGRERRLELARRAPLAAWLAFLEGERAQGSRGLSALCAQPARWRGSGRVVLVGDLLDLSPALLESAFASHAERGRELILIQILAREELAPAARSREWIDAETGQRRRVGADAALHARYERALQGELAALGEAARRLRGNHVVSASHAPFEAIVRRALAGA